MDIHEFLRAHNRTGGRFQELSDALYDVFKEYIGEIHRDHREKDAKRREVKTLLLNALESGSIGIEDASSKLEDGLNALLRYLLQYSGAELE